MINFSNKIIDKYEDLSKSENIKLFLGNLE
jgi:hypothetical protein